MTKKSKSSINDSPSLMKCSEKLVIQYITDNIPVSLDPHQSTFKANTSADNEISAALHSVSSAFNTVSPMRLNRRLQLYPHKLTSGCSDWQSSTLWCLTAEPPVYVSDAGEQF